MEGALDDMLDILSGNVLHDNIVPAESTESTEDTALERAAIDELLGIHPQVVNIEYRPLMIEAYPFDPDSNMVNVDIREQFKNEEIFRETDLFTKPQVTTITMEGFLSGVNCHEERLIEGIEADEDFVRIKCNFGDRTYPKYQPPVKVKKSNRGRKKKPPKVHKRKRQGTGECFNSQTTFVMPSSRAIVCDGVVPSDVEIYKFKVFRTGKIQLPGLRTTVVIDDVMELTKKLVELLNFQLHPCDTDPTKITKLVNLNPVMKNYKFRVKKPSEQWIVNLAELRQLLHQKRQNDDGPKIFDIKYTRQETKLSVRFRTPIPGKAKKRVRVNIFQSGKINILGGHSKKTTDEICEFIHSLFAEHLNTILTKLGSADDQLEDNIAHSLDNYAIPEILSWPSIQITKEEGDAVLNIVDACYATFIADVNQELHLLLGI